MAGRQRLNGDKCARCGTQPRYEFSKRTYSYCTDCKNWHAQKWANAHPETVERIRQQTAERKRQASAERNRQRAELRAQGKGFPARMQECVDAAYLDYPEDACRPFMGAVNTGGYGQLAIGGKHQIASRYVMYLVLQKQGKELPAHLDVAHHCDQPRCINRHHLFLATAKENIADAIIKNRFKQKDWFYKFSPVHRSGYQSKLRRLSDEQVRDIRNAIDAGESYGGIAKRMGLSNGVVWAIKMRNTYKNVQ